MKRIFLLFFLILSVGASAKAPRYIFYFIGDGMGPEHLKLATEKLSFEDFPSKGFLITTPVADSVTDSAAAGTALATGSKTSNGTLGLTADHSARVYSVAVEAKRAGYATGVTSSVSLDHATPAAFYAHVPSRKLMYDIACQLPQTGLDLYAGAGFLDPREAIKTMADSGYKVVRGATAKLDAPKIVWIQDTAYKADCLPAKIERRGGELTLPTIVGKSIDFLSKKGAENGFFLMVEGGQIDWASHANDAKYAVGEVDDFSTAVGEAIKFYNAHPDQTLIIVTADHETGGLHFDGKGGAAWKTGGHTSKNVPIFAIGVGAQRFSGVLENNFVPLIIKELLLEK